MISGYLISNLDAVICYSFGGYVILCSIAGCLYILAAYFFRESTCSFADGFAIAASTINYSTLLGVFVATVFSAWSFEGLSYILLFCSLCCLLVYSLLTFLTNSMLSLVTLTSLRLPISLIGCLSRSIYSKYYYVGFIFIYTLVDYFVLSLLT